MNWIAESRKQLDLAALRALNAEAMRMLRECHKVMMLEASDCPMCGFDVHDHGPDCKLNALLQRTTSEGSQP